MKIELTAEISALVDQIANQYRERLRDVRASGKLEDFTTDIEITDAKFKVIFNLEKYWYWIEHGRKPWRPYPPISAIEDWIRVKRIVPDGRTGRVPDTRQLAFLIARKIATYGTPAHYPLRNTQTSPETERIISAIKQEISKQVYQYITSDEISD